MKAAQELGDEEMARRHWDLASKLDPDSNGFARRPGAGDAL